MMLKTLRWPYEAPCFIVVVLVLPAVYLPWHFSLSYILLTLLVCLLLLFSSKEEPRRLFLFLVAALIFDIIFISTLFWKYPPIPTIEKNLKGIGVVCHEAAINRKGKSVFHLLIRQASSEEWQGKDVRVLGWAGTSPSLGSLWRFEGILISRTGEKHAYLRWKKGFQIGWDAPWWVLRESIRFTIFDSFSLLSDGPSALSKAILLGSTDELTPSEKESFRLAGCSHVLALSGMHLSLWAILLGSLLKNSVSKLVAFILIQSILLFYCFLAGPIPSLLRALIMSFLAGIAQIRHFSSSPIETLSRSYLVCLLLWPDMAFTLSLQLSFLSLVGIFLFSRPWELTLRPFCGRWGAVVLSPSIAALLTTAPLIAFLFQEVRLAGILLSPPLVLLTDLYIYSSVIFFAGITILPFLPWDVINHLFQVHYQAIFFFTGLGQWFPALNLETFLTLFVLGGLVLTARLVYNHFQKKTMLRQTSLNYDSPRAIQQFLKSHNLNAMKRWGQNFLINPQARLRLVSELELKPGEPVWEIGPGLGALTHHLVANKHPLTVFEIDHGFSEFLRQEFSQTEAGFRVVEGDVLKTWRNEFSGVTLDGKPRLELAHKLVGNLPYNMANVIIADLIEGGYLPDIFVATVQKEMAERITAPTGTKNYSSFSVLCQSVFSIKTILVLRPRSFYPVPDVTSCIIKMIPHKKYPNLHIPSYSSLVRACFSHRRKTLRNQMEPAANQLHITPTQLIHIFMENKIDLTRRAETLSTAEFFRVHQNYLNLRPDKG